MLDNPENEFWLSYGQAPNLAYLIQPDGTVFCRQIWLDTGVMEEQIQELLRSR